MTEAKTPITAGRRQFLTRTGLTAIAVSLPASLWVRRAAAFQGQVPTDDQLLATVLQRFIYDTYAGVFAFEVPGNDCYSITQAVAVTGPGGQPSDSFEDDLLDCKLNGNFLALQHIVNEQSILPIAFIRTQLSVLIGALGNNPISMPGQGGDGEEVVFLDEALSRLLDEGSLEQGTQGCADLAPIQLNTSLLIAVVLNLGASVVDPSSISSGGGEACGTGLLTPFARLNFADKQRVFELLDLSTNQSNPLISAVLGPTLLGITGILSGTLLSAAGLVAYSEAMNLDVQKYIDTGEVELDLSKPVRGWEIAQYQTFERNGKLVGDTVHGWDVFEGYWEGRTEATS